MKRRYTNSLILWLFLAVFCTTPCTGADKMDVKTEELKRQPSSIKQNERAQDIDLLWKARALKAGENLRRLQEEMKIKDTPALRLEIMLESAYAAIITMPDVTVKKTPQIVAYHLVLNYGDEGIIDVAYTYDVVTYEYLGVRIDRLPKNRVVLLVAEDTAGDFISISNVLDESEPIIIFRKSEPLKAMILERN